MSDITVEPSDSPAASQNNNQAGVWSGKPVFVCVAKTQSANRRVHRSYICVRKIVILERGGGGSFVKCIRVV